MNENVENKRDMEGDKSKKEKVGKRTTRKRKSIIK